MKCVCHIGIRPSNKATTSKQTTQKKAKTTKKAPANNFLKTILLSPSFFLISLYLFMGIELTVKQTGLTVMALFSIHRHWLGSAAAVCAWLICADLRWRESAKHMQHLQHLAKWCVKPYIPAG